MLLWPDPRPLPEAVDLEDQFGSVEGATVKKAKYICVPCSKDGKEILFPDEHLVCYDIKGLKPQQEVTVTNQFGEQVLLVDKAGLLCVPSTKKEITGP